MKPTKRRKTIYRQLSTWKKGTQAGPSQCLLCSVFSFFNGNKNICLSDLMRRLKRLTTTKMYAPLCVHQVISQALCNIPHTFLQGCCTMMVSAHCRKISDSEKRNDWPHITEVATSKGGIWTRFITVDSGLFPPLYVWIFFVKCRVC